ncbi:MAG: DsbA family oxidoreductase [Daejeonella sp.]|uniref:DsbA family oxidoreductase n=1 Tax=Daejeonella sp. JGW-45 TaxID=3034148 RepID=UPI0023EC2E83|nr:DsbA family oxidoreductase [Daejeonella sp. JGW-45]
MKVEVWSDVMCPFCYIGKRNYEKGLQQFADSNDIELVWKSFQLDPDISEDPEERMEAAEYLSHRKGISRDHVVQMHEQVTQMAAAAGLEYHMDKTQMVNSFKAHRFLQMAKEKGLGDEAEEQLFYANFTEGKDFSDTGILIEIGGKIGLSEADVRESLANGKYAVQVDEDIRRARQIGVTGVPFFVFNGKYAVSGAQPAESFAQVLEKSHSEWRMANPKITVEVSEGPSCTPDGECK